MTHTRTKTYSRHIVKGCGDCPGVEIQGGSHKQAGPVCLFVGSRDLDYDEDTAKFPAWCPLETGDVMITKGP